MSTAASLIDGTVLFLLVSCIAIVARGKNLKHEFCSAVLFVGAALMIAAAVLGWSSDFAWDAPSPIYLLVAPLTFRIDALSSIYAGLLGMISLSVALFSPGYLKHIEKHSNVCWYWVELILFVIGMLGVILAANALTFLMFWEVMALTSTLLIASDLANRECRKAAFIYLGATRISTALLMAGFLWMHTLTNSWNFAEWHLAGHVTIWPGLLILLAFCIKGGIWPFHDWLPYAHPAAPSPVSALLSGVMIKIAPYAIIRVLVVNGLIADLAYVILTLGLISAFWGMLSALLQRDLKTLLAYSSIENVGLILIGISIALIAQGLNLPIIAGISLAAAIFHCVNHGLFKSLLFLTAGTIDANVHTRDMELLGGLGKFMPFTMIFFIIGGAAICALPPLNGFNSKWLIYQSLFRLACDSGSLWLSGGAIGCIGILAIVSGLALYCFTKAIGITFLGRPRSAHAHHAVDGTKYMLAAQAILAASCVVLGVTAPAVLSVINPICESWLKTSMSTDSTYIMPMGEIAVFLGLVSTVIYASLLSDKRVKIKKYITWECGFGALSERMEGTATSFAENVAYTFAPLFKYRKLPTFEGKDRRHFPEVVAVQTSRIALLEASIYLPVIKLVTWIGEHMLMLQTGSVHLYLGYMLVTLVALMIIGIMI
jgi:hydrogenase-4 component B